MTQRALQEQNAASLILTDEERVLHVGRGQPIKMSAGHRILHHDGKCSRPHGHNYAVSVSVTGTLTEGGWIVDKGDITDIISDWDHRFLVEKGDPLIEAFESIGDGDSLVILDHPPTAEVMSIVLEQRLSDALPDTVSEIDVEVRETSELASGGPS